MRTELLFCALCLVAVAVVGSESDVQESLPSLGESAVGQDQAGTTEQWYSRNRRRASGSTYIRGRRRASYSSSRRRRASHSSWNRRRASYSSSRRRAYSSKNAASTETASKKAAQEAAKRKAAAEAAEKEQKTKAAAEAAEKEQKAKAAAEAAEQEQKAKAAAKAEKERKTKEATVAESSEKQKMRETQERGAKSAEKEQAKAKAMHTVKQKRDKAKKDHAKSAMNEQEAKGREQRQKAAKMAQSSGASQKLAASAKSADKILKKQAANILAGVQKKAAFLTIPGCPKPYTATIVSKEYAARYKLKEASCPHSHGFETRRVTTYKVAGCGMAQGGILVSSSMCTCKHKCTCTAPAKDGVEARKNSPFTSEFHSVGLPDTARVEGLRAMELAFTAYAEEKKRLSQCTAAKLGCAPETYCNDIKPQKKAKKSASDNMCWNSGLLIKASEGEKSALWPPGGFDRSRWPSPSDHVDALGKFSQNRKRLMELIEKRLSIVKFTRFDDSMIDSSRKGYTKKSTTKIPITTSCTATSGEIGKERTWCGKEIGGFTFPGLNTRNCCSNKCGYTKGGLNMAVKPGFPFMWDNAATHAGFAKYKYLFRSAHSQKTCDFTSSRDASDAKAAGKSVNPPPLGKHEHLLRVEVCGLDVSFCVRIKMTQRSRHADPMKSPLIKVYSEIGEQSHKSYSTHGRNSVYLTDVQKQNERTEKAKLKLKRSSALRRRRTKVAWASRMQRRRRLLLGEAADANTDAATGRRRSAHRRRTGALRNGRRRVGSFYKQHAKNVKKSSERQSKMMKEIAVAELAKHQKVANADALKSMATLKANADGIIREALAELRFELAKSLMSGERQPAPSGACRARKISGQN